MPQKPVTEQQILDAMEEHSEAWVEQLVRRAKNQRLVLSDETICDVGDYLEMPALMDQVVAVRVEERGPYNLAELNPPIGSRSVCEVVTPAMVGKLLASAGGRFTSDDAHRFCDYHLMNADNALLEQITFMSDLARWDAEVILGDLGYTGNVDTLLSREKKARVDAGPQAANAKASGRKTRTPRVILGILAGVATVAGVALGGLLVVGVIFVVLVLAMVVGASGGKSRADKYPDVRSEYNRRVWADGHDFESDGDSDHNWEADGDRPW